MADTNFTLAHPVQSGAKVKLIDLGGGTYGVAVGMLSLPVAQGEGTSDGTTVRVVVSDDSLGMHNAIAHGTIAFAAQPADANTVVIGDGVHSAITYEFDAGAAAAGSLSVLAARPSAGDTVTIAGVTFEFTNGGGATGGNIEVDMTGNANAHDDGTDLLTLIKATIAELDNIGTFGGDDGGDFDIVLAWGTVGTAGNSTISVTGVAVTKTDLAGGLEPGTAITGGRTGVAIGATLADTMGNLITAINGSADMDITASLSSTPQTVDLAADNAGTAANVTITKSGANITVTGMSGGLDTVSLRTVQTALGAVGIASMPAVASGIKLSPTGGSKTVAAAGTAEALVGTSTKRTGLYVRAKAGNTNMVYLGSSTVDKTTSQQLVLDAGESVTFLAPAGYYLDVSEWFIDVDTNGEGVDFLYW